MRKVSKSRVEEDGISSTNGSVRNDDQNTEEVAENEVAEEQETDASDNNDVKDDKSDASFTNVTSRKSKSKKKNKSKKRKSAQEKAEEKEYEVEKVVGSKKIKGKLHYLIRWKGYDEDNDTWEPENTLSCPELIDKYNAEKDDEKPKEKTKKSVKKSGKRKAKKDANKSPSKRPKSDWDSENADENAEYEVERIMEVHHKKNGTREFLIHWKGWSSKFDSWEPESNLNCPELIKKFMDKVSAARIPDSRSLRVNPGSTNRFTLQDPTSGRRLSKRRGQSQRVRYDNAE